MCAVVRGGFTVDFFYAGGYLFSEIVSVGGGEMCNGCFSFKGECRQPVFLAAVYIVLGPFSRSFCSLCVNFMLVLFMTLGKNVLGGVGVFVFDWVSLFSFWFRLSYVGFIALLSFSSMVWETRGQGIHQVLANSMCRW